MLAGLVLLAAASPLHGCAVTTQGATVVHLVCRDATLEVTDSAEVADHAAFLRNVTAGLKASGAEVTDEPATVRMHGQDVAARRITVTEGERWLVAAVTKPEGTRLMTCHEKPLDDQCPSVMAAAWGWKWRAGPGADVPRYLFEPTLAGRKYQAPKECDVSPARGGGSVTCADGSTFGWFDLREDAEWDLGKRLTMFAPLQPREGDFACVVEGVAARCRQAWDPNGGARVIVSEAVEVRGKRLAVLCYQRGRDIPPACASSLSLP